MCSSFPYITRCKLSMEYHDKVVFFFFVCVLTFIPFLSLAQTDTYEFTPISIPSSTFADNLNRLVSSLFSLTPAVFGFYNLSSGDYSEERANAIALCRREVTRDDCLRCVQEAATNLTAVRLPQNKEAVLWSTRCMFRYSNRTLYGRKETLPTKAFIAGKEISANKDEFERLQRQLLDRLKDTAAAGGPNRKYAQGNSSASVGYRRFYGSAQCTPDLSAQDCNDCLVSGFENIQRCCDSEIGLRWFCPSCNFRFETWRFYEFDADLEADPPAIQSAADPPAIQSAADS